MANASLSRETLLPKLAAHVLEHGMEGASLRPLARAAGTSDRMLVYHFGNKQTLVADLLEYVAGVYSAALEMAMGIERPKTRKECFDRILALGQQPTMQSFLTLWWEIVAGAARRVPGYREAADAMMTKQLAWLEGQMPEDDPDPAGGARLIMTLLEGALMLDVVGHGETARQGLVASGL
ncbi:TetR/AcrR family transcriptional regulator [Erythrobacter sp. THAF29]|uniref:TetR/AcrR family transcriptional regulator n=1 Tax=Erythrobacter sp. THAF29 TaxID=2587851 RepID=UPI001267FA04|nr:TetR/AcrR family transcriptional regulator [Erythrobacter sp. THAF29]QFT78293.1 Transcriptional regulator, TetR family [Erythrobacter sp. THAF29]